MPGIIVKQIKGFAQAQKGDIGCYFGKSLVSRLIEWGETIGDKTKNNPSHIFMMYESDAILEARWPRVAITWATEYTDSEVELYRILDLTNAAIDNALHQVIQQYLGSMYGLPAVAAMAFIEPARALGFILPNYIANKDNVFCSEVEAIYVNELVPMAMLTPASVDPTNMRAWLRKYLA